MEFRTRLLIVGGGLGGCAAAMAATSLRIPTLLIEPSDWLGGQLTAQAVPPDEHRWIEQGGCTRRYRAFREAIRDYYRRYYPLTEAARANPYLNPGGGWVSRLCHEPKVALAVLNAMLAYPQMAGWLQVWYGMRPVEVLTDGDFVRAVRVALTPNPSPTQWERGFALTPNPSPTLWERGGE
ncbi:MAG: FAD-dependent oxidoreductase, partial [Armatimonadota bacterium]